MPESRALIHVQGAHYDMGLQHGRQLAALRSAVMASIAARQAQLRQDNPGPAFEDLLQATIRLLQERDPGALAQIKGIAHGFDLPPDELIRYNLAPFLRDSYLSRRRIGEGCTTWAATAPLTSDGPILVKNRDYMLEHIPLQVVVRAEPVWGHRYTYLTSAGSPGVFVAGFNEAGLAVVDTHAPSSDVGPGLPHYVLAMHVLEQTDNVRDALLYLQGVPRLGRNNFLLADAGGDIAAFEMGHQRCAIREATDGFLVNTNHFNSEAMRPFFVDTEPPALRGNSFERYEFTCAALAQAGALREAPLQSSVDVPFARSLMASHAGLLNSLCRHPSPDSDASTIASAIFLPRQRELHYCLGQPCRAPFFSVSYS